MLFLGIIGRYLAESNGLDPMEEDILTENEPRSNKGDGKTAIFTEDSTSKSTAVECIGKRCYNFSILSS